MLVLLHQMRKERLRKVCALAQGHIFGNENEIQAKVCVSGIHNFPTTMANLL
jgi:hypothetical protein